MIEKATCLSFVTSGDVYAAFMASSDSWRITTFDDYTAWTKPFPLFGTFANSYSISCHTNKINIDVIRKGKNNR
ncbi:hypothetical protein [Proteiniphilum sp. UBA5384]|uniref:hypothetical protein n=1 Tax=Proteiniphilum sp. UBA5384 TaxID=1947279 RepID=UPI0026005DB2|nr:hypothetical protein [Proteiniphilum sp. UBA5384]